MRDAPGWIHTIRIRNHLPFADCGRRDRTCFCLSVLLKGGSVDTAALSSKLVELAALLADRDAKVVEMNDFVKNRCRAVL